jgi:ketosteroid isomerase-like protein
MTSANLALAREFLAAWAAADVARFTELLDEDVSFDSPMAALRGRPAVTAAMADFARAVTAVDNITAAADGDNVLVMYDMHTGPFGTIRAAENYRFRDGRIVSDRLVFDTAPMRPGH